MNNYIPAGKLPHHLSESTFRFYEPYLTLAVKNFPDETSWDVGELRRADPEIKIGPNTFVARFRDAIVSLRRFNWPTTVNVAKLVSIAGQYTITLQAGTSIVWFKHRGHKGRPTNFITEGRAHPTGGQAAPSSVVPWRDATLAEIEALCLLINHGRLEGPFIVHLELSPEQVAYLTSRWNVAMMWDETQQATIVT